MNNKQLILAFICIFFAFSCQKKAETIKVSYRELTEAVYASGNILPQNEYKLFPMVEGYVIQKLVQDGEIVKAGQALFILDNDQQKVREQTAGSIFSIASKNVSENSPALQELKASIESARNKLNNDSLNFVRYQNLLSNNAVAQIDYDKAALAFKNAKNDYLAQIRRYERTKNDLQISLENAKSQYEVNAKENSNFILKSKIDGIVYETYKEQGESVKRGETVALLGSDKNMYLKLSVDELDINKISIGQEVFVSIDLIKDKVFKAKINKIYPLLNKSDQSFRVDAIFEEAYPYKFVGLTVEANIIIYKKNKALVIPHSFLIGKDSVLVMQNSEKNKVKIKKGIENYDWVEVLEGLKENDEISK
ncbi:MAG: efflux RND transporter periplasmic adaptor subunit [Thermoflexibacter sp.]|jgi:multidrug resistance efflux pump|nr:efflux RND transporter periplasmic adaptor subunit [Thermoflexibacter sp.]